MLRHFSRLGILVCAILTVALAAMPSRAGLLDPTQFTSLGTFPTLSGSYTISTNGTPTLTGPVGFSVQGVVYNGIAVFDFGSISLAANQTIAATGSLPVALLSQSDALIAGTVNVLQAGVSTQGAGAAGSSHSYNPGGPNTTIVTTGSGGGGFGGAGANGSSFSAPPSTNFPGGQGGGAYGNLFATLQGGSSGANSAYGSGGSGGGAIEIGAVGTLSVTGSVLANGLNADYLGSYAYGAGGGSGGGILLHANNVSLSGTLSVLGGSGDPYGLFYPGAVQEAGGNGGGGQIAVGYLNSLTNTATINIGNGIFTAAVVPEPRSILMVAQFALVGLLVGYARRRRRAA